MPSWIDTDDGMIYYHFSLSGVIVKVVNVSGNCSSSSQNNDDLPRICQRFNPQLNLSESGIVTILKDAFSNSSNLTVTDAVLRVSASIEKLKFSWSFLWEFELSPCENTIEEVFNPILNSMMLLIEEKNALISLMKKKDKEIAEFQSLGITLSKKTKISAPYDPVKTLKNVSISARSTSEILSNQQFKEVIANSCENKNISTVTSPSKKKKVTAQVGIAFEDSFSQPDQIFTDADIFTSDTLSKMEGDDEVKVENEVAASDENYDVTHDVKPAVPTVKRKKPRRL